jgi:hypothetical protein
MIKSDFRILIREKLDEATAELWTDAQLDDFADEELRTLPAKNVYKEEIHEGSTVVDKKAYPLPTGTIKVEKVEVNESNSTSDDDYCEIKGWDTFAGNLYLPNRATSVYLLRVWIKKSFTPIADLDENNPLDIPDSKVEVLVLGTILRAYSKLMGYFVDLKNWDYNAKPDGITMQQVQSWVRDIKTEYKEILGAVRFTPKPRFIDLIG